MKIDAIFTPTSSFQEEFNKFLVDDIKLMQNAGLEVEIQYNPMILPTGQIVYSALVIGKVGVPNVY